MHMYACLPACLPACAFQTLVLESPVALFPFLSFPSLPTLRPSTWRPSPTPT